MLTAGLAAGRAPRLYLAWLRAVVLYVVPEPTRTGHCNAIAARQQHTAEGARLKGHGRKGTGEQLGAKQSEAPGYSSVRQLCTNHAARCG